MGEKENQFMEKVLELAEQYSVNCFVVANDYSKYFNPGLNATVQAMEILYTKYMAEVNKDQSQYTFGDLRKSINCHAFDMNGFLTIDIDHFSYPKITWKLGIDDITSISSFNIKPYSKRDLEGRFTVYKETTNPDTGVRSSLAVLRIKYLIDLDPNTHKERVKRLQLEFLDGNCNKFEVQLIQPINSVSWGNFTDGIKLMNALIKFAKLH